MIIRLIEFNRLCYLRFIVVFGATLVALLSWQLEISWSEIVNQLLFRDDSACFAEISQSDLRLPPPSTRPPRFGRRLNKLAEEEDWHGRDWLKFLVDTGIYFDGECPNTLASHDDYKQLEICLLKARRKEWEFIQGIEAMKMLGKFGNESTALGIGCGHETVVFYLAIHLKHVIATDLYKGGGWNNREGDPAMLVFPASFSPFEFAVERLSVLHMNGMDLQFPDSTFDVVFSFSSIEHFYTTNPNGFLDAACRSIQEMARVTKAGGVVTIATEVILNGVGHYDWIAGVIPMRNFFFPEEIMEYIVEPAKLRGLYLVEPIDWSISKETLLHSVPLGRCRHDFPHIVLRDRGVVWTSISLAFQKVI